jgi:hypothetical protein
MTQTKIENIDQLRAELSRLQLIARQQEEVINNNLLKIQESLKPENILRSFFSRLTGSDFARKNTFRNVLLQGLSLLLHRFVIKSETKVEEKILDLIETGIERLKKFFNRKARTEED